MKFLVISPHLDDAYFSLTETAMTWVEDGHEVWLLTVFGGIPPKDDERYQKHVAMWEEYEQALRRGPFRHHRAYELLDDAARLDHPMLVDLAETIASDINCGFDVAVWPWGIHHPDHLIVKRAWEYRSHFPTVVPSWFYDELPYFPNYPSEAYDPEPWRCMECDPDGPTRLKREGSRNHLQEKKRICRLFASQMGEIEERCLWVPERVWRPA